MATVWGQPSGAILYKVNGLWPSTCSHGDNVFQFFFSCATEAYRIDILRYVQADTIVVSVFMYTEYVMLGRKIHYIST